MILPDSWIGPLAGLATSGLWVLTAIFFTAAGKRIGSTAVNGLRLFTAVLLLGTTHRLISGSWFPAVTDAQLVALALSGVIGLTLCDQALFTAFLWIGPRRALLVMTTSPLFALLFGAMFLGETVGLLGILGILLTMFGVGWVTLERGPEKSKDEIESGDEEPRPASGFAFGSFRLGVVLAVTAACFQALGALLSKLGMGHGLSGEVERIVPQAATFVRMVFGFLGMLPLLALSMRMRRKREAAGGRVVRHGSWKGGVGFTLLGALVGPFLGVWMSLVAFDRSPIGVAQTLCSLSPVMILPIVPVLYREKVSLRAVVGAVIAVAGTAVLVW